MSDADAKANANALTRQRRLRECLCPEPPTRGTAAHIEITNATRCQLDAWFAVLGDHPDPWRGLSTSGTLRDVLWAPTEAKTHIVPVSVGLRVYPKQGERASRGPFFEMGPTAYFARYRGDDGGSHTALLGGLQAGVGIRFTGYGSSRGEIGVSYHLAEAFGPHARAIGRVGTPGEVDYNLLSTYVAIGFGD